MDIDPETVKQTAPGLIGSLGAMTIMRGRPWVLRVGIGFIGTTLAYFAHVWISSLFKIPPQPTGFFLGLLGGFIILKVIEEWEKIELGSLITQWVRKMLGLGA